VKSMSAEREFHSWEPRELGLPRALLIAILLVAAIAAIGVWISSSFGPKSAPSAIQAVQVTLAQLPRPAPPAPPVSKPIPPPPPVPPQPVTPPKPVPAPIVPPAPVPPPKPAPVVIPKPPPVPSQVPVATEQPLPPPPPPPPVRHVARPAPHPLYRHPPVQPPARPAPARAAPVAQPAAPAAPAAAPTNSAASVVPTSGIPIYGQRIYEIIQANQNVPAVLSEMGLSGTAVIEIVVAPNGTILSARVYKSSGVPIIDSTALQHARDAQLPPFNSDMPNQPHAFLVPIQIQPAND
jgi:periplasmic protein TonB